MVDFVYPSIFGIGASVLFIVLMIACCVRWMRLYKLQRTNTVGAVCDENSITNSRNLQQRQTASQFNYPPPYSIRVAPNSNSRQQHQEPPNYFQGYSCPYANSRARDGFVPLSGLAGPSVSSQGPLAIGVPSFSYAEATSRVVPTVPAPPSYYDDRPPSYDDVVAAGKAITVAKVQKDGNFDSDSDHRSNR